MNTEHKISVENTDSDVPYIDSSWSETKRNLKSTDCMKFCFFFICFLIFLIIIFGVYKVYMIF